MRGWPIYPACDLTTFSVLSCPVKTPKLTGKEDFSGKPLGRCFDNSPWKAGEFESGGDKTQGANPGWSGEQSVPAPRVRSRLTVAFNCGTCPSCFWKLSAFNLRPGPQGSMWERPGYNYRLILPAETKSESSVLPSSKQSLGNSEKLISRAEGLSQCGEESAARKRGPFVGR